MTSRLCASMTATWLLLVAVAYTRARSGTASTPWTPGTSRISPTTVPERMSYTAIVPASGVLIALFTIEQLVNGWKNGFEGPEDRDETREPAV